MWGICVIKFRIEANLFAVFSFFLTTVAAAAKDEDPSYKSSSWIPTSILHITEFTHYYICKCVDFSTKRHREVSKAVGTLVNFTKKKHTTT